MKLIFTFLDKAFPQWLQSVPPDNQPLVWGLIGLGQRCRNSVLQCLKSSYKIWWNGPRYNICQHQRQCNTGEYYFNVYYPSPCFARDLKEILKKPRENVMKILETWNMFQSNFRTFCERFVHSHHRFLFLHLWLLSFVWLWPHPAITPITIQIGDGQWPLLNQLGKMNPKI